MGFKHRAEFLNFRHKMGNVMNNSVNILNSLRKVSVDKNFKLEAASIENTLVGIYNVFSSPLAGKNDGDHVQESITNMENTLAQLNCLEMLLEQERLRIKVDGLNRISRLVWLRISKSELNKNTFSLKIENRMEAVAKRTQLYSKVVDLSDNWIYSIRKFPTTQSLLNVIAKTGTYTQ